MRDVNNQIGKEERMECSPEAPGAPRRASRTLTATAQVHSVANFHQVVGGELRRKGPDEMR
jgi:hypothetical protein